MSDSPLKKPRFQGVTLNKKLIIALAAILVAAVLAIMISSLNTPTSTPRSGGSSSLGLGYTAAGDTAAGLGDLPDSYSDHDKINSILSRGMGISPAAQAQISALQNAQQTLQSQLASLQQNQQQGPVSPQGQGSSMSQEALSSSIFFAGGAPPAQNANAQTAAAAAAAKTAEPAAGSATSNAYQQQNMQSQKLDFLTSEPNKNIYNNNTVQYPASPYIIQAGSVIPAILDNTLVSNLPGQIIALVSQDVYDSISGRYLLIPRGSKLIGEYNTGVSYGQYQLQVKFTRLIRPDGSSILLPNQPGVDSSGSSGFQDEVNNHMGKIIGAAILSAIFNIPSIIATNQMQTSTTCPSGSTCTTSIGATAGASALQAAGQSAANVGNQLASNAMNIAPTIVINSGYQFSVMVSKDIVLPPYSENANGNGP